MVNQGGKGERLLLALVVNNSSVLLHCRSVLFLKKENVSDEFSQSEENGSPEDNMPLILSEKLSLTDDNSDKEQTSL